MPKIHHGRRGRILVVTGDDQLNTVPRAESPRIGDQRNPIFHQLTRGHDLKSPARNLWCAQTAVALIDFPEARTQIARGYFDSRARGIDFLKDSDPCRIRRCADRVELQLYVTYDIKIMLQRLTCPCQARCRVYGTRM